MTTATTPAIQAMSEPAAAAAIDSLPRAAATHHPRRSPSMAAAAAKQPFTGPRLAAAVVDNRRTFNAHIIQTGSVSCRPNSTKTRP
ncbi:hypothetical protein [Tessaracoccus sp. MC1756]|uniref:hypothetical protein n=1 Tax=Tessaracoccus sp. MC1756 TaxID=2760311 RepID=UPI001600FF4C|nr:hypothetical protein [Tessaracoccus sp. MC1756]MBB1510616.1 hypothetical protein [Tessaracoccus sp. MC1756]